MNITEAKKELDYIKTYHKEDGMFFLRKDVLQIIEALEKSVRERINDIETFLENTGLARARSESTHRLAIEKTVLSKVLGEEK